jgi:hypothetical protein
VRLCNLLADLVEANGSRRPKVTATWLTECDRMLRIDKRTPVGIEQVIRWCQADAFWRANVLSMPKLREQYDRLRLAADRSGRPASTARPTPAANLGRLAGYVERKAQAGGQGITPPLYGPQP